MNKMFELADKVLLKLTEIEHITNHMPLSTILLENPDLENKVTKLTVFSDINKKRLVVLGHADHDFLLSFGEGNELIPFLQNKDNASFIRLSDKGKNIMAKYGSYSNYMKGRNPSVRIAEKANWQSWIAIAIAIASFLWSIFHSHC
jgi:hypothetical protein